MEEFSQIEEFCGYNDIGKQMQIHGDKLKWTRGENDFFIILKAKSTLSSKSQRV